MAVPPPNDSAPPKKRPQNAALRPKKRRGRPRTIDDERLLSVAREVFLERGIRATSGEVAERAGISEGVIFHRFKTKEALFRAAMELPAEEVPQLLLNAVERLEGRELEEALQELGFALLKIGRVAVPLMMMSWSNPSEYGDVPNRPRYLVFVKRLAMFFEAQMASGKLRQMDAEVIARAFLGSLHHYCMSRILSGDYGGFIPEGMFVRGLVDLLLKGALASAPPITSGRHD